MTKWHVAPKTPFTDMLLADVLDAITREFSAELGRNPIREDDREAETARLAACPGRSGEADGMETPRSKLVVHPEIPGQVQEDMIWARIRKENGDEEV
jgi:hypothetical protein